MDYLRSNVGPGIMLGNEIDGPNSGTADVYFQLASESFAHGAHVVSVANWDTASLTSRASLFKRIRDELLSQPVVVPTPGDSMSVSALAVFNAGNAQVYLQQYLQLSQQGALPIDVKLID